MATVLNAKVVFTLRDGEQRFRRLQEFCKIHPKVSPQEYRSGFNEGVENLNAVIEIKRLPWVEIYETIQQLAEGFSHKDFFIDRTLIAVPLLELGYFQAEGQSHQYFLGSESVFAPPEKICNLIGFCKNNGLMLARDVRPRKIQPGYILWVVSCRYDYPPNGGFKAQECFRASTTDLFTETGIAVSLKTQITSVIQDDNDEEDIRWTAPPFNP